MPTFRHATLQVLAIPNVRYFVASRFFSAVSFTLIRASVAWDVFATTKSAFFLGLIGLIQFLPVIPLNLIGGAVADTYDRRRIIFLAQSAAMVCSVVLAFVAWQDDSHVVIVYTMVFMLSVVAAFETPARTSLMPNLVAREQFVVAVALHSSVTNIAWVTGPVLAGFLIAAYGVPAAYTANVVLIALAFVIMHFVNPPRHDRGARKVSVHAILEGLRFVRQRSVILAAMTLDMFAVIFAGATAMLPIYAEQILNVGPRGYGLLSASLEIGTVLSAIALVILPPIKRPGRALLWAVGIFGLATILFGLSRSVPLSVAAFMLAGIADEVSVVARSTILQLATPDELRGRVNSVNMIFVNASNQLGVARSGFLAAITSATFSVVFGGIACLIALGVIGAQTPSLRRFNIDDETH